MSFLCLEHISKFYGPVRALDGITLTVKPGSRTAIVGPSGSGKTTLLRIIAGFEKPDHGRVVLDHISLADGEVFVAPHQRGIGIVSQDGALFPHLSVADNIGFGLARNEPNRNHRIHELMAMVELGVDMRERRPHQLSGGQQQRVALARALGRKPKLMLLDEPFSALDTGLRDAMRRAVARVLQAENIPAILVTHDQAEALSFADQLAVLRDGRLIQIGGPQHLYCFPKDRETALFLGDAIVLPARLQGDQAECALGQLAIESHFGTTAAHIMLRPEQIRMTPVEGASEQGIGVITDIEFGGASCIVTVRLERCGGEEITIKAPAMEIAPVNARVALSVIGKAHVLSA